MCSVQCVDRTVRTASVEHSMGYSGAGENRSELHQAVETDDGSVDGVIGLSIRAIRTENSLSIEMTVCRQQFFVLS